jgi:hypothetical protein
MAFGNNQLTHIHNLLLDKIGIIFDLTGVGLFKPAEFKCKYNGNDDTN